MKVFKVKYFDRNGDVCHEYQESWEKSEFFCPACGKKPVWESKGGGDYYEGNQHLCLECESSFYLPRGAEPSTANYGGDVQDKQRLEELRNE